MMIFVSHTVLSLVIFPIISWNMLWYSKGRRKWENQRCCCSAIGKKCFFFLPLQYIHLCVVVRKHGNYSPMVFEWRKIRLNGILCFYFIVWSGTFINIIQYVLCLCWNLIHTKWEDKIITQNEKIIRRETKDVIEYPTFS